MATGIDREQITGVVLAGGRGSRMGGVDKGLQGFEGAPLAWHAMVRLQPQVGPMLVNANRNLAAYESFGWPVVTDPMPDHPGPLAGFLAGLEQAATPWIATVPCDTPFFPADLVERLASAAVAEGRRIAFAATEADGRRMNQPVFALLHADVLEDLIAAMRAGERKIDRWAQQVGSAIVTFDDEDAFANINTLDELRGFRHP